ncbi:MAG: T9SS type A sorting domain-containing protein [Flavobacteriales bacterium]|nr:T9SS type A sorting domain-containing protein [Flavobacteriales bacterium]
MKLITLLLVCTSASGVLMAQNLVPNPDFETRDSDFCGIATSGSLAMALTDWYSPSGGSPDVYFTDIESSCFNFQPNSSYSGPIGLKGSQLPRSGSTMAGFFTYTIDGLNQREYLQVQLMSPLVPNGEYLVEYYVSLADSTEFASNNLVFNLSVSAPSTGGDNVMNVVPQFAEANTVGDTQGWVRVFDTITVSDAYEYLTIGNFSDDASTVTTSNPSASFSPGTYGAYYFVDDVRVTRVFRDVSGIQEKERVMIKLFPNPTSEEVVVKLNGYENDVSIDLIDVKGNVLLREEDVRNALVIDMSQYENGTYFVRVKSDEGVHLEKVIKQ